MALAEKLAGVPRPFFFLMCIFDQSSSSDLIGFGSRKDRFAPAGFQYLSNFKTLDMLQNSTWVSICSLFLWIQFLEGLKRFIMLKIYSILQLSSQEKIIHFPNPLRMRMLYSPILNTLRLESPLYYLSKSLKVECKLVIMLVPFLLQHSKKA